MKSLFKRRWLEITALLVLVLAIVVVLSLPSMDSASLAQMSTVSLFVSLMRFGIAIVAVFAVLRLLDVVADFNWRIISNRIESDALSSAVYLGLRFVAVAYLAVGCLS